MARQETLTVQRIQKRLRGAASREKAELLQRFFKTGQGQQLFLARTSRRRFKYFILIMLIMSLGCSIYLPYHGTVVDAETKKPVKDALVARQWSSCYLCLAGGYCGHADDTDTFTDASGKFGLSGTVIAIPVPGIFSSHETDVAYKPGYKCLETDNKPSNIVVTKIPTNIKLRKQEAENASRCIRSRNLSNVLSREDEFVNIRGYEYSRTYNKCGNVDRRSKVAQRRGSSFTIYSCPSETQRLSRGFSCKDKKVLFSSNDENVDSISPGVRADDWNVRKTAAWKLGKIDDPRAVELLVGMLGDPNKEVVKSAVRALGMHLEPRAIDPLVALLNNSDIDVVSLAAETLGKYDDQSVVAPLRALLNDRREGFRLAAVTALGNMCDKGSFDLLISQLEKDDSSRVRAAIVMIIPTVNGMYDARVASALISVWKEEDDRTRAVATDTLEQMGEEAIDPLIETTKHHDPYFRWKAARVLGKLNSRRAVPSLLALLGDESPEVRWTSLEALGSIRDNTAVGPITELLRDKDTGIVEKAQQVLKILDPAETNH